MLLSAKSVSKSFASAEGPFEVLRDVSFDLAARESAALTGESGSGKSTLLHLIGGLDLPDGGEIVVNGTNIAALDDTARAAFRRRDVGVVFQQFNLIPSLTVEANIAFHARLAGRDCDAAAIARTMGVASQLGKYPEDLSGGQQQRVAIARTIAARPALILADEPTGNLDERTANAVFDAMLAAVEESGAALLMVTHSERLAARLPRRLHLTAGRLT